MFPRISGRMATVKGNENAVPADLKSSSSESTTKTPQRGLEQAYSNDPQKWRVMKPIHLQTKLHVLNWTINWILPGLLTWT